MIQGYFDESITSGEVLILAGVLSTAEKWEEFSDEWQGRLNDAPWDAFKMSDIMLRCSDTSLDHAKWHYFTLRKFVLGAITVAVPIAPLEGVVEECKVEIEKKLGVSFSKDPIWKLDNPYMWAVEGLIKRTVKGQREWGLNEPVDFIFDERSEKEENAIRKAWEVYKCFASDEERSLLGRKPRFEDDKKFLPLQGADLWAWCCRMKWKEEGRFFREMSFPVQWGDWNDFPSQFHEVKADELRFRIYQAFASIPEFAPRLKEHGFLE